MDTIQRISEYKRLALIMREYPSKELATELAGMCDKDRKLRSDRNRAGFGFHEEQACIRNSSDGNHPYDRLLVIFRKRKDTDNELRVVREAINVFEKVVSSGRADGPSKLEKYQKCLEKILS